MSRTASLLTKGREGSEISWLIHRLLYEWSHPPFPAFVADRERLKSFARTIFSRSISLGALYLVVRNGNQFGNNLTFSNTTFYWLSKLPSLLSVDLSWRSVPVVSAFLFLPEGTENKMRFQYSAPVAQCKLPYCFLEGPLLQYCTSSSLLYFDAFLFSLSTFVRLYGWGNDRSYDFSASFNVSNGTPDRGLCLFVVTSIDKKQTNLDIVALSDVTSL